MNCQPLMSFPAFLKWALIFSRPTFVTFSSAFAMAGSSLLISKLFPGTIPIFAIFATIGASASVGGLSFISFAKRSKYAWAPSALNSYLGALFMSFIGSSEPGVERYDFEYELRG